MTTSQLFDIANVFVLPFWTLMIVLPNWEITKRVMASLIPFAILALVYLYLLSGLLTPESAQALANPKLSDLAQLFSNERATATGWIHFLVMDLFVGRWIYWEGQRTGILTVHSIVLCLFAGPLGLLSHVVTAGISQLLQSRFPEAEETTDPVQN
jgi:uncharacterized SAM-binding protein YcdF (DUF218 family)